MGLLESLFGGGTGIDPQDMIYGNSGYNTVYRPGRYDVSGMTENDFLDKSNPSYSPNTQINPQDYMTLLGARQPQQMQYQNLPTDILYKLLDYYK